MTAPIVQHRSRISLIFLGVNLKDLIISGDGASLTERRTPGQLWERITEASERRSILHGLTSVDDE